MPLLIAIVLLLSANPANAAPNCSTKVCVKVYTDPKTGKLIITAKQNGSSTAPKPIPTRTWKPRPYTPKPSPVAKPVVKPQATVVVTKKYPPKPVVKLSLSDQLAQLIPIKEIHHQLESTFGQQLLTSEQEVVADHLLQQFRRQLQLCQI